MAAFVLLDSPPMPRSDRARQGGFSFIELIVATSLMVILGTMAVMNFSQLRGPFLARQAAMMVAAEFQQARMRAIATNSNIRFNYDSSTNVYAMQRQTGASWTTERTNQLPTGVTITGVGTPPQFTRTGTLNADYTVSVTAYGSTRTVAINVLGKTSVS